MKLIKTSPVRKVLWKEEEAAMFASGVTANFCDSEEVLHDDAKYSVLKGDVVEASIPQSEVRDDLGRHSVTRVFIATS